MLDERGEISPFGWAVGVAGRPAEQVAPTVRTVVEQSAAAWKRCFPAERGYQICVESRPGTAQGIYMTVRRGDFQAEATVEHDLPSNGARSAGLAGPSVRAFGRARSESVVEALERGKRVAHVGRIAGGTLGLSVFFTLAWLMVGVNDPIYVLGGMLLVVTLLLALMAGALLGGSLGERLAASYRFRACRDVEQSPGFDDDVRRWKTLTRQLLAQRSALAGRRGQPFRREPQAS